MWYKNIAGRFFGLVTKHGCETDRQTDRQTDRRTDGQNTTPMQDSTSIAEPRGKNRFIFDTVIRK